MANELKFGNKVVFLNGLPLTLPIASSDPGSATAGDLYYNSSSTTVRYYNGSAWFDLATGSAAANTALSNLSAVAINTSLLPGTDNSINLGSSSFSWASGNIHSLKDSANVISVNLYGRALVDSGASTQIAWSTSGVAFSQLTASTVPYLDASKILTSSSVTPTELGFLSGVTSSIQTQINSKAADNIVIKKDGSVAYTANQPMGTHKLTGLSAGTTTGDSVRYEQAILASGVNAWSANQDLGGFLITGSGTAVNPNDLVSKSYVDNFINATSWKTAVLVATTANITLSGEQTIDGFLTSTSRVLVKNQSTASQNGIYVSAAGAWSRSTDMNLWSEVPAAAVFVQEGTVNADIGWVCTAQPGGTLGTTAINFVQFSSAGAYSADGVTLQLVSGTFSIKNGGVSDAQVNSAAAIARSKLASGTAFAWVTNNVSGVIQDTSVTASRAVATDANGLPVASATTATELGFVNGVTSSIQTQLNGKANTALSNLASTAVNVDILPSADLVRNLGSAVLRWTNLFAGTIDGGANSLTIKTSGGNGSLLYVANGTGNFDISATKFRRSVNGADTTNFIEDQYFDSLTLTANTSSVTEISSSLSFALATWDSAIIEYKIKEATSNKVRVGQFIVTTDGTIASSSDQFSESSALGNATGLSLSADISGGNVRILYNNTHATNAATMRCNIRRIRT